MLPTPPATQVLQDQLDEANNQPQRRKQQQSKCPKEIAQNELTTATTNN